MSSSTSGSIHENQPTADTVPDSLPWDLLIDGTTDKYTPPVGEPDIVWYDAEKDAESLPKYTRQYLRGLSMATNTRIRLLDNAMTYFPTALARTRSLHKWLVAALVLLGLLWLGTAVFMLLAVLKGKGLRGKC